LWPFPSAVSLSGFGGDLSREIERAPEKNDNEKSKQLKFFARPPRSARSMSDDHLVPCDDY
jgi:hypothetical protein